MFEGLSEKLERSFKVLKGQAYITEVNIADTMKEIRRALLDADVSYKIAKDVTNNIKEKALGQEILTSVKPGEMMVKIVHDELAELMGGEAVDINLKGQPSIILIAGLQGSGKTTFSAKLASYLKRKRSKQVLLVAGDVYRPAAIEQLKVLGQQVEVEVYSEDGNKNPVQIAQNAINHARNQGKNVVIIDTAGRLAVDEEMMNEIANIKETVHPHETLFVVDSMTGQDAVNTAKAFNDRLDFDGVVLTKLDGDTRGGAALTIRTVVENMGDIVSLVERAQEQFDEEEARKLQKKLAKNEFNYNDFLKQIQQIKKMGNLKDLASMIPGMDKALKGEEIDDDAFKSIEAIIYSMTPAERENPKLLNGTRRKRIADGSGTSIVEVNRLVKQFEETSKMMRMMTTGGGKKLMRMAGNMKRR